MKKIDKVEWKELGMGTYMTMFGVIVDFKSVGTEIKYTRTRNRCHNGKFALIYREDGEYKIESFLQQSSLDFFVISHYNNYLEQKEKERKMLSAIYIQQANAENYLEVQRELLEQDYEIVGLDIIDYPNNFCIKYRKTKCV